MNSKILINILIVILIGLALFFGYLYLFPGEEEDTGISRTSSILADSSDISPETSEFLILLRSLNEVSLDDRIFENQVFSSQLVNFSNPIPQKDRGRSNPFAPLGTANLDQATFSETTNTGDDTADTTSGNTSSDEDTESFEDDFEDEFDEDYLNSL